MHPRNAPLALALTLTLGAARAHSTEPATVHVVLHASTRGATTSTFVDIDVRGTEAPIRLVRRVDGACETRTDALGDAGVLVRVECAPGAVTFEVAREGGELVVRRSGASGAADAGAGAADAGEAQVIARAVLPPHATVRVR